MKFRILHIFMVLFPLCASAQSNKHYQLDSVIVKTQRTRYEYSNFSKTIHSYYAAKPADTNGLFASKVYRVAPLYNNTGRSIVLDKIVSKLKKFDTAMLEVRLIIYQPLPSGNYVKFINVNPKDISKNKWAINLAEQQIILQPGVYYMGYKFSNRAVAPWHYREYIREDDSAKTLVIAERNIEFFGAGYGAFQFSIQYHKAPPDSLLINN